MPIYNNCPEFCPGCSTHGSFMGPIDQEHTSVETVTTPLDGVLFRDGLGGQTLPIGFSLTQMKSMVEDVNSRTGISHSELEAETFEQAALAALLKRVPLCRDANGGKPCPVLSPEAIAIHYADIVNSKK